MAIQKMKFGIIGYPVQHSLSPILHTTAFKALDLPHSYEGIEVHPTNLRTKFKNLLENGFSGFNVTIPHKQVIMRLLDERSPEATAIGAVNTVVVRDGATIGHNTDVAGILKSLLPLQDELVGKKVMVLGTGGAAHAVMYCLLKYIHPNLVRVASRTMGRAINFVSEFDKMKGNTVLFKQLSTKENMLRMVERCDLIINTTPVGMSPHLDQSPLGDAVRFRPDQIVMDLIYTPMETTLLRRAREDGARTINGLETLIHQAAEAFKLWTGLEMPVREVREALMRKLAGVQ